MSKQPYIEIRTDSQSLIDNLESKRVVKDPRLRVDIARLREMIDIGEIYLQWVPKREQIADALTKEGASSDLLMRVLSEGSL